MSRIAVKVSFLKRIPLFFYCSQAINATNTFIVKIGFLLLRPRTSPPSQIPFGVVAKGQQILCLGKSFFMRAEDMATKATKHDLNTKCNLPHTLSVLLRFQLSCKTTNLLRKQVELKGGCFVKPPGNSISMSCGEGSEWDWGWVNTTTFFCLAHLLFQTLCTKLLSQVKKKSIAQSFILISSGYPVLKLLIHAY